MYSEVSQVVNNKRGFIDQTLIKSSLLPCDVGFLVLKSFYARFLVSRHFFIGASGKSITEP